MKDFMPREEILLELNSLRSTVFDAARNKTALKRPRRVKQAIFRLRDPVVLLDDPLVYEDWDELYILYRCIRRQKGRLTHKRLSEMEKRLVAMGFGYRFSEFFNLIKELLAPEFITPHGYVKTFSSMKDVDVWAELATDLSTILEIGDPVILYSGTLLGYIREGQPIAYDDDIDVAVFLGEHNYEDIPRRWYSYKKALFRNDLISKESAEANSPVIKVQTRMGVTVDLFPAWSLKGKFSVYPFSLDEVDMGTVLPFQSLSASRLKVPANPEAFLEYSYGSTWRIPDPLFCFDWEHAYRKFELLVKHDFRL